MTFPGGVGAAESDRPLRTPPIPAQDQERRPREQVGKPPRDDLARLDRQPFRLQVQAGQDRRPDPTMDLRHHLVQPVFRLDQLARTAASLRQTPQESFVHGAVDADREYADATKARPQLLEDLVLVADLTIGDEHENVIA